MKTPFNLVLPLGGTLALVVIVVAGLPGSADEKTKKPTIKKLGEDRRIANPKLTAEQRKAIAQAKNINNSDVDLYEFQGRTIIYYSWATSRAPSFWPRRCTRERWRNSSVVPSRKQ